MKYLMLIVAEVRRTCIKDALVLDQIEDALELGFSGVMIDASLAPLLGSTGTSTQYK